MASVYQCMKATAQRTGFVVVYRDGRRLGRGVWTRKGEIYDTVEQARASAESRPNAYVLPVAAWDAVDEGESLRAALAAAGAEVDAR